MLESNNLFTCLLPVSIKRYPNFNAVSNAASNSCSLSDNHVPVIYRYKLIKIEIIMVHQDTQGITRV